MSKTPIADLIEGLISTGKLVSTGIDTGSVLFDIRTIEQNTSLSAKAVATINKRRLWDRERKRKNAVSTGKQKSTPSIFSLAKDSEVKKERKSPAMQKIASGDLFGNVPAVLDDWPEDYGEMFWAAWPSHYRKHSKKQVLDKLAAIRKIGGIKMGRGVQPVTWSQIWAGLTAYLASNPEHKFIPCPLVWVNQARWMADYSRPAKGLAEAPARGFGAIAFGRRA